jgi:hypothetical protein
MASSFHALLCAAAGSLVWMFAGLAIARRLEIAPPLAGAIAPSLGWAVHSAVALPLLSMLGFSRASVLAFSVLTLAASGVALLARRPPEDRQTEENVRVPAWAWLGAALVALVPMMAILPKFIGDGVALAPPIFDHSKVAIIDEIARLGLPPGNPFFDAGEPSRLVYYYLWHFSAAELALLPGMSGWEADVALTWFSAFASLMLMIGLATWLSSRASTGLWVLLLCLSASLRPILAAVLGPETVGRLIWAATGFAGWLFQAAWVPQHLMSASCVVLAAFLLCRLTERRSPLLLAALALVVTAGFESSTWVGGVTFAMAAPAIGLALLIRAAPPQRLPFLLAAVLAGGLAVALAASFLHDQYLATAARGLGSPVAFEPYEVLALWSPDSAPRALDLPAYWLVLLPVELPAIYLTGSATLIGFIASRDLPSGRKGAAVTLGLLALAGLAIAWLLASTIGRNNDLAWRAVLPAVMVLTAFAAVGLARVLAARAAIPAAVGFAALALGVPDGVRLIREYATCCETSTSEDFAGAPRLWEAVRRHAAADERVGNNPLFLEDLVPWPINMSWALLANRRSCFASAEFALVFTTLPPVRRAEIDALFVRVFAGGGTPDDVMQLATRFDCRVVVLTSEDEAWSRDPFAASPYYRSVEAADEWRIYRATTAH